MTLWTGCQIWQGLVSIKRGLFFGHPLWNCLGNDWMSRSNSCSTSFAFLVLQGGMLRLSVDFCEERVLGYQLSTENQMFDALENNFGSDFGIGMKEIWRSKATIAVWGLTCGLKRWPSKTTLWSILGRKQPNQNSKCERPKCGLKFKMLGGIWK